MVITGYHAIEEQLKKASNSSILYVSARNNRIEALVASAKSLGVTVYEISKEDMEKLAGEDSRGIALQTEMAREGGEREFKAYLSSLVKKDNPLVLVLDGITDPHNYGAVLRSADQFSVDAVVVRERRSVKETPVVAKTSAGAVAYMRTFTVPNLHRALEEAKKAGFWIYGADMGGSSAPEANFIGPTVLVLGNEGSGISRLLKENCDTMISIPSKGHVDSLNVSVAAGILLYEIRRQQDSPATK